mmetsp:Transcript_23320/g.57390  ORF Transcript_23320/g.57390 Transcript_23320/m.57390 type:complete len:706 (+) Transcript_23320:26-2143(+)
MANIHNAAGGSLANGELKYIDGEPNCNDVKLGRGGGTNTHLGNKLLRKKVEELFEEYNSRGEQGAKTVIAQGIITSINKLDPPGRFVKKESSTDRWYEVGLNEALEKTAQTFRNVRHKRNTAASADRKVSGRAPSTDDDGTDQPAPTRRADPMNDSQPALPTTSEAKPPISNGSQDSQIMQETTHLEEIVVNPMARSAISTILFVCAATQGKDGNPTQQMKQIMTNPMVIDASFTILYSAASSYSVPQIPTMQEVQTLLKSSAATDSFLMILQAAAFTADKSASSAMDQVMQMKNNEMVVWAVSKILEEAAVIQNNNEPMRTTSMYSSSGGGGEDTFPEMPESGVMSTLSSPKDLKSMRSMTSSFAGLSFSTESAFVEQVATQDANGNYGTYTGYVWANTKEPHGVGRMQYHSENAEFHGNWLGGGMDGLGIYVRANGDTFVGQFSKGKLEGPGYIGYGSGDFYFGGFSDHQFDGKGLFKWADGRLYIGEYRKGQQLSYTLTGPDGQYQLSDLGTAFSPNAPFVESQMVVTASGKMGRYTGYVSEHTLLPHGMGRMIENDTNDEYHGTWFEGEKDGTGMYKRSNGKTYVGNFKKDMFEGYGFATNGCGYSSTSMETGTIYFGKFRASKCEGQGFLKWKSGGVYIGEFRNGQRSFGFGNRITGDDGRYLQQKGNSQTMGSLGMDVDSFAFSSMASGSAIFSEVTGF